MILEHIRLNKIFQNISVYFILQLTTALLPIIIIPIITRKLSLIDIGNYSLYKSVLGFLIPLVGLSFSNAVIRKYFSIERQYFFSYLFTLIFVVSVVCIGVFLIFLLNMGYVMQSLKTTNTSIVLYSLSMAYLTSVSYIFLGYYRVIKDIKKYIISNSIIITVTVVGLIILMTQGLLTLGNLLNIHLFALAVSVFYNLFDYFKRRTSKVILDFSNMSDTLKYCLPLILFALLAQLFALGDRFFINYFLDKDSLALYSVGHQMAFAIPLVGQSIQLAWTPFVFEQLSRNEPQEKLRKFTFLFIILLTFLSIIYAFVYPMIFKLFLPQDYYSVLNYYYFFIIAGFFQSLYWLYNPFLLYHERNSLFVYITLAAAAFSVTLNYLYVERGLMWMASIFALSWLIQFVCLLIAITYVKKLKMDLRSGSHFSS